MYYVDSVENADWIKTPGNRASEAAIHDELARRYTLEQARKMMGTGPLESAGRSTKAGRFVTIEGKPVFVGGPGAGGGSTGSGSGVSPVAFDGNAKFADLGGPAMRATYDGNVSVDKGYWEEMSPETRKFSLAHEIAHHKVEDYVLSDPASGRWDAALDALTVKEIGGRRMFVGGNFVIGEAVVDSIAAVYRGERFGNISDVRWNAVQSWAKNTMRDLGYSFEQLGQDVDRLYAQLESGGQ